MNNQINNELNAMLNDMHYKAQQHLIELIHKGFESNQLIATFRYSTLGAFYDFNGEFISCEVLKEISSFIIDWKNILGICQEPFAITCNGNTIENKL